MGFHTKILHGKKYLQPSFGFLKTTQRPFDGYSDPWCNGSYLRGKWIDHQAESSPVHTYPTMPTFQTFLGPISLWNNMKLYLKL